MGTNLKNLYEAMPEVFKRALARPIHNGLIGNKIFKQQIDELVAAEAMSEDELTEMQLAKLRDLCEFCYSQSLFYRARFDEAGVDPSRITLDSFAKLPLLDKEQVLANYADISIAIRGEGFYAATTGGSSGRRLVVINSNECFYRENAFAMHFYARLGYDYRSSRLSYFGGDGSALITTSPLYNMIRCNTKLLNESNLDEAMRHLDFFAPDYIRGLPSSIGFFAQLLIQTGKRLRKQPKGLFLQSENVHPYQLEQFKEAFGCPVRASYGSTERTVFGEQIGWSGEKLVYSFNKLYGLTEFDKEECIIGTGFINWRMPLLRYVSDDAAERCAAGYAIQGHRSVPIIGKHGEHISTASLCDLDESVDRLLSFQFVQEEQGRLRLDYVSSRGLDEGEAEALLACLNSKFMGNVDTELRRVDRLQLTPRGKRTLLIQRLKIEQ